MGLYKPPCRLLGMLHCEYFVMFPCKFKALVNHFIKSKNYIQRKKKRIITQGKKQQQRNHVRGNDQGAGYGGTHIILATWEAEMRGVDLSPSLDKKHETLFEK
jgi:hypothetical protein